MRRVIARQLELLGALIKIRTMLRSGDVEGALAAANKAITSTEV